ncbi:MAG: hypothetical protein KJ630_19170 [Proteobacteria bacterium]|nr:hypothetical protein [Pseudomonadota bacterium]
MRSIALLTLLILSTLCGTGQAFMLVGGRAPESAEISLNTGHSLGDMVACYILNEGSGTTLNDLTANGYDLTLSGGYSWPAGGGVAFDGIDAKAQGTHTPVTAYPLTLFVIIEPSTAVGKNIGIGLADSSASNDFIAIATDVNVAFNPLLMQYTSTVNKQFGSTQIYAGTEYAIATVITEATDREVFLDGVSDGAFIDSDQFIVSPDVICIGAYCDSSPAYGTGTVRAAYIYSRALSDSEVLSLSGSPYQMINNYNGP